MVKSFINCHSSTVNQKLTHSHTKKPKTYFFEQISGSRWGSLKTYTENLILLSRSSLYEKTMDRFHRSDHPSGYSGFKRNHFLR